jgi:hypothetical protein
MPRNDAHNHKVKGHNSEARDQDLEALALERGRIEVELLILALQLLHLFVLSG